MNQPDPPPPPPAKPNSATAAPMGGRVEKKQWQLSRNGLNI